MASTTTTDSLQFSLAFIVGPDPCCLSWPSLLHVCLPLAPATTQAHATARCSWATVAMATTDACPCPLAVVLGGATEHPNSSGSLCISPVVLINDHMVVDALDPNGLSWQATVSPWIWCCHTFCTWPACSRARGGSFNLQNIEYDPAVKMQYACLELWAEKDNREN